MARFWEYGISQGYGPAKTTLDSGYKGVAHFNKGIDFMVPQGTEIGFPVSGMIKFVGNDGAGWGKRVVLIDAHGNEHSLGHMSEIHVTEGQMVDAEEPVGLSGGDPATKEHDEKTDGPHVSYEVFVDGEYIDPSGFVGSSPAQATSRPQSTNRYQKMADQLWGWFQQMEAEKKASGTGIDRDEIEELSDVFNLWREAQDAATKKVTDKYDLDLKYTELLNKNGLDQYNVLRDQNQGENTRRIAEYNAKVAEISAKMAAGRLTLDQAQAELQRWVAGRQEGRQRAEFVEKTLAEAAPWATTGGKSSFTSAELGGGNAALARLAGLDPEKTGISFPGVRTVDPLKQLADQDAAIGVGGPMPTIPKLPDYGSMVPSAPGTVPFTGAPPQFIAPPKPPDVDALMSAGPGTFATTQAGPLTTPYPKDTGARVGPATPVDALRPAGAPERDSAGNIIISPPDKKSQLLELLGPQAKWWFRDEFRRHVAPPGGR